MKLTSDARRTAWMLISPAVVVLLLINLFPIVFAVYISLHQWQLGGGKAPRYDGLFNYEDLLFYDDRFWNSIVVSLVFVTVAVAVEFVLGFLLAFLFSAKVRGLGTLRKIYILPIMVMPMVAGLVWFYMFNENFGVVNWLVTLFGSERLGFLTDNALAMVSLVIADMWQWTPFVMLVLFAAIQSLPEYVYEAAKMDGLDRWQTFWRVTVPLLRPAMIIVVLIRFVDAFRMVELVFMMTQGGPGGRTEVMPWYLYTTGFRSMQLGYAAAMAVLMIVLITILTQLFVRRLGYREA
ncbi:MAG: sugar ABC transporter permease [Alphaproteobacteria bacterium]